MDNNLIKELWQESVEEHRCRYLSYDGNHCLCGMFPANDFSAYAVCDSASLQLWCLGGADRHRACIFYDKRI